MEKEIVIIHDDKGRAGTKLIADGFDRKHDQVLRLVKKYKKEFEKISPLKGDIRRGRTKSFNEFLLDEDQFMFLGSLFKNNPQTVAFKLRVIEEFKRCRKRLAKALKQNKGYEWNQIRLTGKTVRLLETGAIQEFITYAKDQGGTPKGCDRYYSNFTCMTNALLFICESKFKNLRDILSPSQLLTIGAADQIINKSIRDDMKANVFYKDIYQNAKKKVKIFAELNGKSEVLAKQFMTIE